MGYKYKSSFASIICVIILILTTQNIAFSNSLLESEISVKKSSNIISGPSISPTSTTLRLANNTPMADITFSYTASSNGQVIPPDNMSLLRDVSPGSSSSHPDAYAVLGNELLFAASNGTVGEELWKTDGTTNGTVLVKDIRQGNLGSAIKDSATVGSTVFFRANDGINGAELWKTDGTTNGTVLVKDISPGGGSALEDLTAVGNKLFFKADDGINGAELWVSDGTPSGTFMVKDIKSGAGGSSIAYITSFNGKAYFRAQDDSHGSEIWYSDGTENGTEIMMDFRPGSAGNSLSGLVSAGENLYFGARGDSGRGVFVSNGTANGTHQLTTSIMSDLGMYVAAGNNLFFKGNDGQGGGQELWFTNGTVNGTVELDILPGIDSENKTLESAPKWGVYHPHDGNLYFYANEYENGTKGYEFWKSDGTLNGTQIVNPGSTKPGWTAKQVSLLSAGRYVYYPIWGEGEDSRHLFRTDGTENGTIRLGEHSPDQYLTHPDSGSMAVIAGTFYATLGGGDSGNGYEVYYITNATGILADANWSVYPTLPLGLSVDSTTGEISGTPIAVQSSTQYTIWANTSLESASATVNIEIVGFPEFSYEPSVFNLVRLHEMPNAIPTTMGGVIESWEIVPSLPSGLNFDLTNGQINGIPTVNQVTTTYSIWGNNSAGSYSFDVMIDVSEETPNIVYQDPSKVATQYVRMDDLLPTSNGGEIDSWEISPDLPLGLFFNNGSISGIPTVNQSEVSYTVWANNSEGSDSDVITIEIQEPPLGIVISQSELILVENIPMDTVLLIYTGGLVDTWELEGTLPSGLVFDTANLTISGTPNQIVSQTNVTIWANSSLISDSEIISIHVLLDTDGDSMADDFGSLSAPFLVEDNDDDNDGISDSIELSSNPSTNTLLADTDGDGVCDGSIDVYYDENHICSSGYDYFPTDPSADADTDGDNYPDVIRSGYNSTLTEDDDDDGDGLSDVNESLEISQSNPLLADTDGDGFCDGSIDVIIREVFICNAGPDAFPSDAAAHLDTDGDGKPDDLFGNSSTGLVIDLDDDGDQSSDIAEIENGTDPKDPLEFPTDDDDSDGWTNSQEMFCGTDKDDANDKPIDFDEDHWCDADDPDDDNDGWPDSMEVKCGSNPLDGSDIPGDDDNDGICNKLDSVVEDKSNFFWWLVPLFFFVVVMVLGYLRMGRLSKQMSEVITTSHIADELDSVWKEEKNLENADQV